MPIDAAQTDPPLVSVVVPAFNAQDTLGETLSSIQAQTCRNLEILIVDDGSTDDTAAIAQKFCRADQRAQLIRQSNAGVARARNAGIARSCGAFIAPIDADDLWHPEKVSRQLALFEQCGDEVALVYNWSRIIDDCGRVIAPPSCPVFSGDVLRSHLRWNFIGNGSTPMFRASVFRDLQYDDLRVGGDQGCEDFLLQLQVAARFEFACAPAFLTGYRQRSATMSGDLRRMIELHVAMYEILLDRLPRQFRRDVQREIGRQLGALAVVSAAQGRYKGAARSLISAVGKAPIAAIREVVARATPRSVGTSELLGQQFAALSADEGAPVL